MFVHCWWECKLVQPLRGKKVIEIIQIIKNRTTISTHNPTSGYCYLFKIHIFWPKLPASALAFSSHTYFYLIYLGFFFLYSSYHWEQKSFANLLFARFYRRCNLRTVRYIMQPPAWKNLMFSWHKGRKLGKWLPRELIVLLTPPLPLFSSVKGKFPPLPSSNLLPNCWVTFLNNYEADAKCQEIMYIYMMTYFSKWERVSVRRVIGRSAHHLSKGSGKLLSIIDAIRNKRLLE